MRQPVCTATVFRSLLCVLSGAGVALSVCGAEAPGGVLHIGNTGDLSAATSRAKEKGAMKSLQNFIKDETGLENEITTEKDWRELSHQMSEGKLQVGVFQGYEFAWAKEKYPALKPLALAVNVAKYPVVIVVAGKDDEAKDFAGLKGQVLCLPKENPEFVQFSLERQVRALDQKKLDSFFSKVTAQDNVEDALDDVVDGVAQVTAADRAALERYKSRKPARFARLKEIAQSPPFPPVVIAYREGGLDDASLRRFRDGLLNATRKEKGRSMLTMFHLTGFEAVPDDFDAVLAKTRKTYPADEGK
jgi:ABC-type phosphate/phosphonate transport system substrate-binding protein